MTELTASRTLVKSPPELWAECSDAASLGRHLDQFGEIRITRLEPETAVAWEGERASGTVRLEPSGWGTRVVLTAQAAGRESPASAPQASEPTESGPTEPAETEPAESEPADSEPAGSEPVESEPAETEPSVRPGPFARLRNWFRGRPSDVEAAAQNIEEAPVGEAPVGEAPVGEAPVGEAPVAEAPVAQAPSPPGKLSVDAAALEGALESLGQAHHRPFSRA